MPKLKTYYITKYALTSGIIEEVGQALPPLEGAQYIRVAGYLNSFLLGRDIFTTIGDARIIAYRMRDNKVVALSNQLARMKAKEF